MERNAIKKNKDGGQAMMLSVVVFLFVSLTTIAGLVSPTIRDYTTDTLNLNSKKVYYLTESGSEDYLYRLFNGIHVEAQEQISLDNNTVTTAATPHANNAYVESVGSDSSINRTIRVDLEPGLPASFYYGAQVGTGGVDLQSSTISGNVYSNGPITGDTSSSITGTAISASGASLFLAESYDLGTPGRDISFGNSASTEDLAQGFVLSSTEQLNKISLYVKKVSSPANATVKITTATALSKGLPTSTVLATGTLNSSSVASTYSWVDVTFTTSPTLTAGTPYFIVIDASTNAGRYYVAGAPDTNYQSTYSNGEGFLGVYNTSWANPWVYELDFMFKIYLGGNSGLIAGSSGSQWNPLYIGTVSGTAQANTVNYVNSTGLIYCQNGTGNNKSCTNQSDPQYSTMPIPQSYIDDWKTAAEAGGVYSGNYSVGYAGAAIGPKKINGNLTVSSGGTLTVNGTLWVTGNISLSGGSRIVLSSSYGTDDGVIVADGTIAISGGSSATGSGVSGSYLLLLTTSTSSSAISISGGSGAVILYAADGTLNISGGASLKEATANRIVMSGSSQLIYETGLVSAQFTSGPTAVSTLSIGNWKETQ